jgi:6-pyruvoyltetrahydropterin/6-carboxytetrahydropterin synthase
MSERFYVHLEKRDHVFSAAHFITYNGDVCEPLHGHNYRVWAEVEGPLDENHYVVDFIALRDSLTEIIGQLNERTLLPTEHPQIRLTVSEQEVEARFDQRRWVFPRQECALLPLPNTTAELLARHIGRQLVAALEQRVGARPAVLRLAVDENSGQWGVYEHRQEPE